MFFHSHSRAKSPAIGRRFKYNRNDLAPMGTLVQRIIDFAHHCDVEDIEWRTRESYARNAIFDTEFYVLIGFKH
jgi:hypothetical protein